MPIDYRKYPPDWGDISKRIRERAGNVCEECGVPNGSHVTRAKGDRSQWTQVEAGKGTRIVLTVHHIGVDHADGTPGDPRDKMDVRDENLIALCQACHLAADLDHHIAEARKTRARKRHEQIVQAGQRRLI
jgi:5-methylcytosine-specific restriction endonuclease McrA